MLKTIKHGINLLRHALRDVGSKSKRSSHWHSIEKSFLKNNSSCAACGSTKRLNVHHCVPFHINPILELELNNLITLCMDHKECHLKIGHGLNFRDYVQNVREYAADALMHPEKFDDICEMAKANRIIG